MAFVELESPIAWPFNIMRFGASGTGLDQTVQLHTNALGEKAFTILKVPPGKGGTIKGIHAGHYESTSGDIEYRVETVNSDGDPTGTLVHANAKALHTTGSGNNYMWQYKDFDGTFTIADGDWIAVGWENKDSIVDIRSTSLAGPSSGFGTGFLSRHYTTAWVRNVNQLNFGFRYSNNSEWLFGGIPPAAGNGSNPGFDSNDTPNERGMSYTVFHDMRFVGWHFWRPVTSADYELVLYDGSGEVASVTVDESVYHNQNFYPTNRFHEEAGEITLTQGTEYVIAFRPTSTTDTINPGLTTWASDALRQASWFKDLKYAAAHNPSDATDFTTDGTKAMFIFPLIDAIDIPTGGDGEKVSVFGG